MLQILPDPLITIKSGLQIQVNRGLSRLVFELVIMNSKTKVV